jgi:hypothetical protein
VVVVYIAHPISGAVEKNLARIEEIVKHVLQLSGRAYPIAPYRDACRYLCDAFASDRDRGMKMNELYFTSGLIDELWVCGKVSQGVRIEIEWALENNIDVVFKNFEHLFEEKTARAR